MGNIGDGKSAYKSAYRGYLGGYKNKRATSINC